MTALKKCLTTKDVCASLRLSRSTVWVLVRNGELRPARLRVGKGTKRPRLRFDPEEVERYVRRCMK